MPATLTVHVAGDERSVAEGTTAGELFAGDRAVVVARVGGELRRPHPRPGRRRHRRAGAASTSPTGCDVLRHRTAHVLAQAVQQVNPAAKLGIGPPISDGFYYDFDVETPFTPEDLKALEKTMQRIINEGQTFHRRVTSDDDARAELADEPYKLELIGLKGGGAATPPRVPTPRSAAGELTIYDNRRRDGELGVGGPVPRPAPARHQAASATPSS